MGIQTMGFHGNDQQSHLQTLSRQNSWYSLTLNEVENHLGKPLGSINLDEFLQIIWTAQKNQSNGETGNDNMNMLMRAFSGKTVNEVWREIEKVNEESEQKGQSLGEITLEGFLVKSVSFASKLCVGPTMGFLPQIGLSPSTSIDTLSDNNTVTISRKRGDFDGFEKNLERRLRRKIKNRESAARSRARKQAYHNELVSKVTRLEEENLKLKKDKQGDGILPFELSPEPRYQLRRTSSL